jgi:acetylornithine deacetylase/succinyl-diaminopimelate desuccinylase-like protein
MDLQTSSQHVTRVWADEIVPQLHQYIEIPALSPSFDADWVQAGHIESAVELIVDWIEGQPVEGMEVSVQRLQGRTPLVVAEIDAFGPEARAETTTVLYGHLDKQPEMEGWRPDLGPWTPVMEGTRLYGRGGADDGYAAFASLAAVAAVQAAGGSHNRLLLLIEASEESGSPDLPAHIDALAERLGDVDLVICLDSGCATYETLWLTSSLRGLVDGRLEVKIVTEGLHSGAAGGVVASTFRIARQLLDRVEDAGDGRVLLESANVDIPDHRLAEAKAMADLLGHAALENLPLVSGARPALDDVAQALVAKTWQPSLAYTGIDGMPSTALAGNVLRPSTTLKLSLRIPPTADPAAVEKELSAALTADPPYGAQVTFSGSEGAPGWNAPDLSPWLRSAVDQACRSQFGQGMQLYGEGGTIPFMGMLGQKFPAAQFVITGVLGPGSNAHGPNEFIDVAYAETLTKCLAEVLNASCRR